MAKAIKQQKKKPATARKKKGSLAKLVRVTLWLALSAAVLCLTLTGSWFLFKAMLWNNPRLKMEHVVIDSDGWWQNNELLLCRELALKPGEMNLFSKYLKLNIIRRKLLNLPSIYDAVVSRELPDTLKISIVEKFVMHGYVSKIGFSRDPSKKAEFNERPHFFRIVNKKHLKNGSHLLTERN